MNFGDLSREFPREAVHWRAQSLTRNGDKAMALAYIDARDVMNRLDEAVGPENWQDEYTSANGRTICRIGIKIGDAWVWKSDGAGDTDVEKEKGGISDAFKRAAVKWGIGRYLYSLPTPWVACETYERNGKKVFSRFTADPWAHVRTRQDNTPAAPDPVAEARKAYARLKDQIGQVATVRALDTLMTGAAKTLEDMPEVGRNELMDMASKRRDEMERKAA